MAKAFSSPLFLAFAVLVSANSLLAFMYGTVPDIFTILFTVGVWMIYSSAFASAKNPAEPLQSKGFSFVHGTVKAMRIFYIVVSVIAIAACLILLIMTAVFHQAIANITFNQFRTSLAQSINNPELYFQIETVLDNIWLNLSRMGLEMNFGFILLVVATVSLIFGIIAGVAQLVISLTFMSKLKKFTATVRDSVKLGIQPSRSRGLGVWFLVIGILTAIFSPAWGAALIVLYVWYKKFFPVIPVADSDNCQ